MLFRSVLPSLYALKTQAAIRERDSLSFLGVGDPMIGERSSDRNSYVLANLSEGLMRSAPVYSDKGIDATRLRDLPALQHSRRELEDAAQSFATSHLLMGEAATETAVKSQPLDQYDVVSFATHGILAGEITGTGEPGLVLTPPEIPSSLDDGLLAVSDILELEMAADWVILSACNTAAGENRSAAAYSGLARAFIHAGAESLLVSHWPVRDDVAAELTVSSVRYHRDGMSKAQALQASVNALRRSDMLGSGNPAVWAPFVLVEG